VLQLLTSPSCLSTTSDLDRCPVQQHPLDAYGGLAAFMPALLQQYKAFVKKHPSLVQNAERLLHWLVWNPERFSGSE
jgi:hypothetical protein